MKTIQDLKDNREVIIDIITEECGAENVKEVMDIFTKYIGFRGYFEMSPERFAKAVIKDSGISDTIISRNGVRAQRRLEEINMESSRILKENI